jgi:hypothetical protein
VSKTPIRRPLLEETTSGTRPQIQGDSSQILTTARLPELPSRKWKQPPKDGEEKALAGVSIASAKLKLRFQIDVSSPSQASTKIPMIQTSTSTTTSFSPPEGDPAIYGYPEEDFPPTDFHTATLVGNEIILIGSLGYPDKRDDSCTQVLRLYIDDWTINKQTTQNAPGWISNHQAEFHPEIQTICIKNPKPIF